VLSVGEGQGGDMSWIDYIALMTNEEWATVGLRDNIVKKVLEGGALSLNKSVHEIPLGGVIDAFL
jgi:hypothetical protein